MSHRLAILLIAVCLAPATVRAQADLVATAPPNLVIGNYNSTSVGPYGGLEGTAYAARVEDPSASWFNPAGLARQSSAQISGSAGVYQRTAVAPQALPNQGGSIQQLPNFVGFTFSPRQGMTVGAALLSTNAWNQETDSELISPTATGQQRFAYSADSNFEQRVLAFGVGVHRGGPWRFGGGLAFSLMDLRMVQSASDRIADTSGLRSLLVSARASGSALQLRAQGGAQYETEHWRFGGAMRTPGVTFHKTGVVVLDGVVATMPSSYGTSIFDPDAALEYHLPWEFQGGAAYVHPRVELEFDVLGYTGISAYSLLSSDQPVLLYSGDANGTTTVTSRPFAGLTSASNGVVNVSAGGHVKPFKSRDLLVHGSVGSNMSPVAPADTIFNKADLATWSVGISGTLAKFRFTAGVNHQSGNADDVEVRNLLNGQVVHTTLDIRLLGFVYALAYQF